MQKVVYAIVFLALSTLCVAQSPFASSKQSILFSNAQSGASERWIALFAPASLSTNYRLILPTTAPSVGQYLQVTTNSGSDWTLDWVTPSGGVSGSGSATRVAFWSGTSALSSNANLYWDNTNNRLGIGTASPQFGLDVVGADNTDILRAGDATRKFLVAAGTFFSKTAVWIGSQSNHDLAFFTNDGGGVGPGMLLTTTGRLGLGTGTATPAARLEVSGTTIISDTVTLNGYSGTSGGRSLYLNGGDLHANGGTDGMFGILQTNSGTQKVGFYGSDVVADLVIDNVANTVGIGTGTTSGIERLEIKDGNIGITNTGTARELRFYEPSASGSNYSGFKAQAQAVNLTYTLPSADGSSGQVLSTNGSGTLSWANNNQWSLIGNASTSPGTNFVGTTDAQDVMFKANSTERFTIKQSTGFLHLNQINQNTMMGYQVANIGPSGGANTGIGYQALYNTTTGSSNVALGFVSLSQNQTGSHNTAIGTVALNSVLGSYNVGLGSWAGYSLTGDKNTVLGYYAGFLHTSGNQNIFIGDSSRHPSGSTGSNLMSIGNAIYGNGINTTTPKIGIGAVSYASDVTLDVRGHSAISNSDNTAKELRLYEPSSSGLNYTAFKSQAQAADVTYTMPSADGTSGQVLSTNGSGTLSWSSASTEITKVKTTTESISVNTTLQDDDDLYITAAANEKWIIEVLLDVTGSPGDIKVGVLLPSGTMALNLCANLDAGNSSHVHEWIRASGVASSTIPVTDDITSIHLKGVVSVGATGGNVRVKWAQATSSATATSVKSLSFLKATKVQ